MIKFIYNNKPYSTPNLAKKLKKMGITEQDITITKKDVPIQEPDNSIIKHHFKLPNGFTVTSIYDNLNHLNIKEYTQID